MNTGTCRTFYPNKVYTKQADGEIVRVVSQVNASLEFIVAYYR
jgi:hypothetical protein